VAEKKEYRCPDVNNIDPSLLIDYLDYPAQFIPLYCQ